MRIAIDARPSQGAFTGDATYSRGYISGIMELDSSDEYYLYYMAKLANPEVIEKANIHQKVLSASNWRIWSTIAFPAAVKKDYIDIAHVQYSIPPFVSSKIVTSVHDVSFKRHPEFFTPKDRFILDMGMRLACKKADMVFALSEYTKSEICSLYPIDEDRVRVVYPGIDSIFAPRDKDESRMVVETRYNIHDPFILSVGVIQPRKNLPRLLEAFAICKKDATFRHKLVIVGKYGWMADDISKRINELNIADDIVLTGYVPYDDLPYLYSAADIFVYPSVYEGFGLPPLEAMACGTPAITGDRTSLPEVVGDAGITVNPDSAEEFAAAIIEVLRNQSLQSELRKRGLVQAARFSWAKMAKQVNDLYHEIAGG